MFTVAGDGASIADSGGDIRIGCVCGWRMTVETGVKTLLERSEVARACVKLLSGVRGRDKWVGWETNIWQSLAGFGFKAELFLDEAVRLISLWCYVAGEGRYSLCCRLRALGCLRC
jgi:hypothetical protein